MLLSIIKRLLALSLVSFLGFNSAVAAELFGMNRSVRALGMGDAYTAVVDDSDSLFYNPAGIAKAGYAFRFVDINLGLGNPDGLTALTDLQSATGFADTVRSLYGEQYWAGGHGKVAFTTPFLGVAAYGGLDTSVGINNPAVPELDVNMVYDYGVAMGFAFGLLPGFSVGATVKRINRTGGRNTYGASYLGTLNPDGITEDLTASGVGYSLDIGSNISVGGPVSPTLSFSWKNVGGTSFRAGNVGDPEPPKDISDMTLGASLVIDTPIITLTPAIDIRYLDQSDINLGKKIHMGVEIDLPIISARAGLHQGYMTYGASVGLGIIDIEAASYGVELGEYPGQLEDRRYVIQAIVEIDIGGGISSLFGGGSSGSGGKKGSRGRRRKRRR